jgi:hypothetical protein
MLSNYFERLFTIAVANLRPLEYTEDEAKITDPRQRYVMNDFDSKADFQSFYSLSISNRMDFAKHLSKLQPALAILFAEQQLTHMAASRNVEWADMTAFVCGTSMLSTSML